MKKTYMSVWLGIVILLTFINRVTGDMDWGKTIAVAVIVASIAVALGVVARKKE